MKVIITCSNSEINKCYSSKVVTTGKENEQIEVVTNELNKATKIGLPWVTNTVAFVIEDGTMAIMAYNPNCEEVDPFSAAGQAGLLGCIWQSYKRVDAYKEALEFGYHYLSNEVNKDNVSGAYGRRFRIDYTSGDDSYSYGKGNPNGWAICVAN